MRLLVRYLIPAFLMLAVPPVQWPDLGRRLAGTVAVLLHGSAGKVPVQRRVLSRRGPTKPRSLAKSPVRKANSTRSRTATVITGLLTPWAFQEPWKAALNSRK